MKLFWQKAEVQKFEHAKDFAEEYNIGKNDFILASKSTYETYFAPLGLEAHVEFKSKYGKGEPTDVMIDALLADFRKTDCDRIIAIGGGAVIDLAKILVLAGNYTAEEIFGRKVPLKRAKTLIAVPTTCGAGSEVSNVSIAEFTKLHTKMGLAVDEIYADRAVLIPELLTGLPYSFFATSAIDALLADFRKTDCDRIIAIGGGAVIDMAKILVLAGNYTAEEIFGRKVPLKREKTLIAVPTTCGAGSEVSNVSIAEFTKLHTKMGLAVDEIYADRAVLIPELLTGLPYSFFATSAIDAFIHAIESYVSPKATLYTQMFSMKAMEMIIEGFQKIAEHGEEYRMNLLDDFLTASNLAGIAFGNAGTGAVHAMSYPLSGVYHVTHGEANYQFLTAVFAKYQELDPNGRIKKLNVFLSNILECKSDEVYTKIEKLLDQIIARKPLHEYGMKEEEIESFAKTVEETQQRLLNQSYVKLTWQQMAEIYKALY